MKKSSRPLSGVLFSILYRRRGGNAEGTCSRPLSGVLFSISEQGGFEKEDVWVLVPFRGFCSLSAKGAITNRERVTVFSSPFGGFVLYLKRINSMLDKLLFSSPFGGFVLYLRVLKYVSVKGYSVLVPFRGFCSLSWIYVYD